LGFNLAFKKALTGMGNLGVKRAEGMPDFWGDRAVLRQKLYQELLGHFQSFGYQLVEVPLIEQTELYLRKSGEDIVAQMYDFNYQNRRLCLRPEMTASVIRCYLEHFPSGSHQRLCYGGAVFRYENLTNTKEPNNYRQFTQVGIELIGSSALLADAEVIYTACASIRKLGGQNFQLIVGHIGVLLAFLKKLDLNDRVISILLAGMELLHHPDGKQKLDEQLQSNYLTTTSAGELAKVFGQMDEGTARSAILEMLESLRIEINGNRDPREIADRLIAKLKHQDQTAKIQTAIQFMMELVNLQGLPYEVLDRGKALLQKYQIDLQPLSDLRQIIELLEIFNGEMDLPSNLRIDLGLTRGLQYYTGTIFELLDAQGNHLGGGGRYDDLVFTLGGKSATPATGFSLNIEKLHSYLELNLRDDHSPLIIIKNSSSSAHQTKVAIQLAQHLRSHNFRVELALDAVQPSSHWYIAPIEPESELFQLYDPRHQTTQTLDTIALTQYLQAHL
jgi:histidyl-tRNA synthetase